MVGVVGVGYRERQRYTVNHCHYHDAPSVTSTHDVDGHCSSSVLVWYRGVVV